MSTVATFDASFDKRRLFPLLLLSLFELRISIINDCRMINYSKKDYQILPEYAIHVEANIYV